MPDKSQVWMNPQWSETLGVLLFLNQVLIFNLRKPLSQTDTLIKIKGNAEYFKWICSITVQGGNLNKSTIKPAIKIGS